MAKGGATSSVASRSFSDRNFRPGPKPATLFTLDGTFVRMAAVRGIARQMPTPLVSQARQKPPQVEQDAGESETKFWARTSNARPCVIMARFEQPGYLRSA